MARSSLGRRLRKLSIAIHSEAEEAVLEMLSRHFRNPPSAYHDWESDATWAVVYLEAQDTWNQRTRATLAAELRHIAACGLNLGSGRMRCEWLRREDWADSWKRHFKPIRVGRRLLIKPSWSRQMARPGQAVVILDPGLSFGTGQHATTSFCLRALARPHPAGASRSFLDMGTGSGILAIAAAKLGYAPVEAFDFDPEAVRTAKVNAGRNRVGARIQFRRQDLLQLPDRPRRRYDVVAANLMHDLLIDQATKIVHRVAPGGELILAGILTMQFPAVEAAYARLGWQVVESRIEKEWQSGRWVHQG